MKQLGGAALFMLVLSGCGSESSDGAPSGGGANAGGAGAVSAGGTGSAGSGGASGGSAGSSSGGAGGSAGSVTGVYGNVWSGDSLQNWDIGGPKQQRWSYRFRAPRAATVEHVRVFFVTNPADGSKTGYSGGTGGTVEVELCADDGTGKHAPDCAKPLATAKKQFALVDGKKPASQSSQEVNFPSLPLAPNPTLQTGVLYHLVFSNVDAAPLVNWIGLDGITEFGTTSRPAGRPTATDWGLLLGSSGSWAEFSNDSGDRIDTPVLAVVFSDGSSFGCGYVEVWPGPSQERAVDDKAGVRQRFVPPSDVTVTAATLRLRRSGSSGKLGVRLERDDGTLLEEASVDAAAVDDTRHAWVQVPFAKAHALGKGVAHRVTLVGLDGGTFVAHCIRDGGSYGFEPGSTFADGWAEFDGGDGLGFLGWYGWSSAGNASYQDGDLQLYFDTVQ